MRAIAQLCGFIIYALFSTAVSQSAERLWHTTTAPRALKTVEDQPLNIDPRKGDDLPVPPLIIQDTIPASQPSQDVHVLVSPQTQDAAPVFSEEGLVAEKSSDELPKPVIGVSEPAQQVVLRSEPIELSENVNQEKDKKKPRKWLTVPSEQIQLLPSSSETEAEELLKPPLMGSVTELPTEKSTESPIELLSPIVNTTNEEPSLNDVPSEAMYFEEEIPMLIETIISKKTTVYLAYLEVPADYEPIYVNLTGIRDYTGTERELVGGTLDLSDLYINGEEAKEVIQRMAQYKFHRIDLSGNRIEEFPSNTFSPVAFTVRELRLDGNPLLSNTKEEGSVLQRGGLFHLTELRELHAKNCGLEDIDFFTPWNSNHLEVVDLSCNKLRSVPSNLQFFHKLKKLNLDGNPITQITELPFALLWNMQVLSMSSCLISSITSDPFRNMEHLKELSLDGNNLTDIAEVRLSRASYGAKLFLSSNPWHCACHMLHFIEQYHYAIRDLEDLRCDSPRWLEGLRTAYLTKEILSLDSEDGDCSSEMYMMPAPVSVIPHFKPSAGDNFELLALIVFFLAAAFMIIHVLCTKKKEKFKFDDERTDINYIRIDKKSTLR